MTLKWSSWATHNLECRFTSPAAAWIPSLCSHREQKPTIHLRQNRCSQVLSTNPFFYAQHPSVSLSSCATQVHGCRLTSRFHRWLLTHERCEHLFLHLEPSQMISAEVPVLFSKAASIFIRELTLRAWIQTEEAKRRTLQVGKRVMLCGYASLEIPITSD